MTFNLEALLAAEHGHSGGRLVGDCVAGAGDRIFGGQALAQALTAAGATVDAVAHPPSSIHGHFLSPGDASQALEYDVVPLKDGRSFACDASTSSGRPGDHYRDRHVPRPEVVTRASIGRATCARSGGLPAVPARRIRPPSPAYDPVEARLAGYDEAVPSLAVWLRLATDCRTTPCCVRQAWSG